MKSCLVIDDSQVVRKVARRIAEQAGFKCIEADNGVEAFEICESAMPDAIVLDWNMPSMSGIEFLERLRGMKNGTHPKVILCSAENDSVHVERAIKAGADEYVMKPFDSEILMSKFLQIGLG